MERWDPVATLELIERHRVTHSHLVPTMFHRLLSLPDDGAQPLRRVEPQGRAARSGTVPGQRQAADDRVVGAGAHRVLRGHRGRRHRGRQRTPGCASPARSASSTPPRSTWATTRAQRLPADTEGLVWLQAAGAGRFEYFGDGDKTARTLPGRPLHPRRRRSNRRRRLPVPDRPEREPDHLRWREHLPGRGRRRAARPSRDRRRRHHRGSRRRVGRGRARRRRAEAGRGRPPPTSSSSGAGRGWRRSSARGGSTSPTTCRGTTTASSTSAASATSTAPAPRMLTDERASSARPSVTTASSCARRCSADGEVARSSGGRRGRRRSRRRSRRAGWEPVPEERMGNGARMQFSSRTVIQWEWQEGSREIRLLEPCDHLDPALAELFDDARLVGPVRDALGVDEVGPVHVEAEPEAGQGGQRVPVAPGLPLLVHGVYARTPPTSPPPSCSSTTPPSTTAPSVSSPGRTSPVPLRRDPADPTRFLADPAAIDVSPGGRRRSSGRLGACGSAPFLLHRSSPQHLRRSPARPPAVVATRRPPAASTASSYRREVVEQLP